MADQMSDQSCSRLTILAIYKRNSFNLSAIADFFLVFIFITYSMRVYVTYEHSGQRTGKIAEEDVRIVALQLARIY